MADNQSASGTPSQAAAATATPAPAPVAPAASSLTASQDFAAKVAAAKTPAEVRALKAEMIPTMQQTLKTKPRDWDGKEVAKAPEPTPAEAPAPEETPAEVETPAETPAEETPPADPAADPDADPEADEGEGPISPITGKRTHLRLAQNDKVGRLAASFMRRNKDMGMEEAIDRARDHLGIKPQGASAEPATPESNLPKTVEDTQASIAIFRAERKKASAELRVEDVSDLSEKIEDLLQHRITLERQGEKAQVEAQSAYDQAFAASETRATDLYDFVGKPESEGAKRMLEIESELRDNGDPLYHSPDKPLRVAQMVAAELHIAPRRKGAPATPVKPAAPANGVPAAKKNILPGGGSRTTPPPVNQPPAIQIEASQIRTPGELRAFKQKHGLKY